MFRRAIRFNVLLLLLTPTILVAQTPAGYHQAGYPAAAARPGALRPVPRSPVSRAVHPAGQSSRPAQGWNLQWRRSAKVRSLQQPTTAPPAAATNGPIDPGSRLQVATDTPQLRQPAAGQILGANAQTVAPRQRWGGATAESPSPIRLTQGQSDRSRVAPNRPAQPNFFEDPFGDEASPQAGSMAGQAPEVEMLLPPPAQREADPVLPAESRPMNQLRESMQQGEALSTPVPEAGQMELPSPDLPPAEAGPSLGDFLRDRRPGDETPPADAGEGDDPGEASDQKEQDLFENPFDRRQREEDQRDRDRIDSGRMRENEGRDSIGQYGLEQEAEDLRQTTTLSCDEFRGRIIEKTIDQVSLDISPPFRPDELDLDRYQKLKDEFDEKQEIRQWRTLDGQLLAAGRLRDLAYEKAVIETEFGTVEELPINRLSEEDIAYITENWGLPRECLLEQVAYTPRNWNNLTMTWKASNLCHTPLYFDDVNLERYGHTHGPFAEPLIQSAHFFGSIVVLPYKMGVHTPGECQYALGYYRPGNCAPWITPAIPLSARGAIAQAATMTGLFWLIP